MVAIQQQFEKPEEIATNILSILSKGAYVNFPQALKEIVSNSFDAGARRVHIRMINDGRDLLITDDGAGMTKDEFRTKYTRIASPKERELSRGYPYRPIIGMLGIGALAVAPVCEKVKVLSSKGGNSQRFEAVLDYYSYLDERSKGKPLSEVYQYIVSEMEWSPDSSGKPFTYITLENLNETIQEYLKKPGLSLTDYFETIEELSGIAHLAWHLGSICPVGYPHPYPIVEIPPDITFSKIIQKITNRLRDYNFHLFLEDSEVFKPVYLPSFGKKFKAITPYKLGFDYQIYCFDEVLNNGNLRFHGYMLNQAAMIVPRELQGILIRIKDVAIGSYRKDLNLMGAKHSSGVFPTAISGELFIESGLENALTFDRADFREDDPDYIALCSWLQTKLAEIKSDYWNRGRKRSEERQEKKSQDLNVRMSAILSSYLSGPYSEKELRLERQGLVTDLPCKIDSKNGVITINVNHMLFKGVKTTDKIYHYLQAFVYALELGRERSDGNVEKMLRETLTILADLLAEL